MASIMSSTIINVAIPDMSLHFALGQERAQWVSSGFMVAMTASMLTTPWLLARYGYQRVYAGCMLLLLAGGVVGGPGQRLQCGDCRAPGRGFGCGCGSVNSGHRHLARF
jgi:MFS family permease